MNIEQARFNMIEQQIRTWDVLDTEILDLLQVVRIRLGVDFVKPQCETAMVAPIAASRQKNLTENILTERMISERHGALEEEWARP